MEQAIMNKSSLGLPLNLAQKIGTEKIIVREVEGGLMILPLNKQKSNLRGLIKNTGYSTETFFEQKRSDKELEE